MIVLQAISVIFGFFMLYWVRTHYSRKHMHAFEYGMWTAIWIVFIFLAIFPQTFQGIVESLHISRVFDLFVMVAFMILTFLTFQNRIHHKRMEKKLEEIVRGKAIHEAKNISKN